MQGNTVFEFIQIWSVLFNFERVERFEEESDVFREVRGGIRYSNNCQECRITEFLEENSTNSLEARGHSEASSWGRSFAIKLTEHVVHLVKSILKQEVSKNSHGCYETFFGRLKNFLPTKFPITTIAKNQRLGLQSLRTQQIFISFQRQAESTRTESNKIVLHENHRNIARTRAVPSGKFVKFSFQTKHFDDQF